MSQMLSAGGFKWVGRASQFRKDVLKIYIEDTDKGYILEVHVQYPEKLNDLNNDLPFLPERMKIQKIFSLLA